MRWLFIINYWINWIDFPRWRSPLLIRAHLIKNLSLPLCWNSWLSKNTCMISFAFLFSTWSNQLPCFFVFQMRIFSDSATLGILKQESVWYLQSPSRSLDTGYSVKTCYFLSNFKLFNLNDKWILCSLFGLWDYFSALRVVHKKADSLVCVPTIS